MSGSFSTQSLVVNPLRGMDDRWRTQPNRAGLIQDMVWDERDAWRISGGIVRISPDYVITGIEDAPDTKANANNNLDLIHSLHWFAQHTGGIQWLLFETALGDLRYFNGSIGPSGPWSYVVDQDGNAFNGTARKRAYTKTPWASSSSLAWGGRLYLVNGVDEPLCFDGIKASRAGFPAPAGAPDAWTADASGGSDVPTLEHDEIGVGARGKFVGRRYKVTYVNERGQESPASQSATVLFFNAPSAGGVLSGENERWPVIVNLPIGDTNVVARRLYATQDFLDDGGEPISLGEGEQFFFHTEIQDNVTGLFIDLKPDANLGSVLVEEQLGVWPTGTNVLGAFKSVMFAAGSTENEVHFSATRQPEVFPPDNVLAIGDADAGPVTGMYATRNALIVFRRRAIYLIKGDSAQGFYSVPLNPDIGCAAGKTIRELPGLGLIFLSEAGVYLLEGALENTGTPTGVRPLSTTISDTIAGLNLAALDNACGVVHRANREYWLQVPEHGDTDANLTLKLAYEIGEWSVVRDLPIRCAVVTGDHRQQVIIGSWDSARPGLWTYSEGVRTKGDFGGFGSGFYYNVEPIYQATPIDLGSIYTGVRLRRFMATVVGYGASDMRCNVTVNRQTSAVLDEDLSADQAYPVDLEADDGTVMAQYGTIILDGSSTWALHRPVPVRFDLSTMAKGPVHELYPTFTWEGGRGQILGWEVDVDMGPRRTLLPLSGIYGAT